MKIVWDRNRATVRDVYETMRDHRRIAYTTVMTMMKILEQKRYLKRYPVERAYVYEPTRPKNQVIKGMIREFLNRVFNGSAEPLLIHLVEDQKISPEDLQKIQKMIRESR